MRPFQKTVVYLAGMTGLILLTACGPSGGSGSDSDDSGGPNTGSLSDPGETLSFEEVIEALLAEGEGKYRVDTETDLTILAKSGSARSQARNYRQLGIKTSGLTLVVEDELPKYKSCDLFNTLPQSVTKDELEQNASLFCQGETFGIRYFRSSGGRLGYEFACDGSVAAITLIKKLSNNTRFSLGQYSLSSDLYDDVSDASIQCGSIEDTFTSFEATEPGQMDMDIDLWTLNLVGDYTNDQRLQVSATFSGDPGAGNYTVTDNLFEVQQGGIDPLVYIGFSSAGFSNGALPVMLWGESGTVSIQSISEDHYEASYDVEVGSPVDRLTGSVSFNLD